jgi:hypoxanthine phosphoribosyltransferase
MGESISLPAGVTQVLFDAEQIAARVDSLAWEVSESFGSEEELTVVGVLHGSLLFMADLIRRLPLPVRYELVQAESYAGTVSTGDVRIHLAPAADRLRGRNVLLIDDILDTGRTLAKLRDLVLSHQPRALRIAVLLRKRVPRAAEVQADFVGFDLPDGFVVGYGLDYNGRFRNLPYIGLCDPGEL